MAAWYSNILTKTTSQISNLRTTLLSSEADGDTEDDTHVCRVLRDYYTEKGRPFPAWLPPDPKAPPPTQPLYAQPSGSQIGSRYGGLGQAGGGGGQQGGLSSLWGDSGGQQQQQAPQSLRAGRGPAPGPMQQRGGRDDITARPLPSQRLGSYQTQGSSQSPAPVSSGGGGGGSSAQDRLRQRFRGGGNSRGSSPSQGSQSPFQPPGGAAGYDGGGGGGGGNENPYVSSNAPWSTGDDPYAGGSGGGGGGGGGGYQRSAPPGPGRRQGLPSGPRGYR